MKRFAIPVVLVLGLSLATGTLAGPKVFVFNKRIELPNSCVLHPRALAPESRILYSCDKLVITFSPVRQGELQKLRNLKTDDLNSHRVETQNIEGKDHFLVQWKSRDGSKFDYMICDNEICLGVGADTYNQVEEIVNQISNTLLNNNLLESDAPR